MVSNLTSQFFANAYLNELDQFIKRTLKIKYYLRYVDDMVVLSKNPAQIRQWRYQINHFLEQKLTLKLHPAKDKYGSVYQGIDFVGYLVKPNYVLARKRVVKNLKTKLYYINKSKLLIANNQKQDSLPLSKPLTIKELHTITAMINSYYGHFLHASCFRLRKNLYEKHFGILKKYIKPLQDYKYFTPHDNHK